VRQENGDMEIVMVTDSEINDSKEWCKYTQCGQEKGKDVCSNNEQKAAFDTTLPS
jgi:hypothetical protein